MTANVPYARPPLRFRRVGGGYNREDVELLLRELTVTVGWLEHELETLRQRATGLEAQLNETRLELDAFRGRGFELARAMTNARMTAERIERDAQKHAAEIVAAAAQDAVRRQVELDAELEAPRTGAPQEAESFEQPDGPAEADAPAAESHEVRPSAHDEGHGQVAEYALFAERVELDAGPFADFDSLSAFERELARLPNVEDVYVRRVDGDRAVIELTFTTSAPLLAKMREHLPYFLSVRGGDGAHLVMDVQGSAGVA